MTDALNEMNSRIPLHGGVLATLVDVACATTLTDLFDVTVEIPVSTDLHVRYFRQPRAWPLVAEAQLVNQGRSMQAVDCVVRDAGGAELARASGTYLLVRGFGTPPV